jgi:hypothetical protein
MVTPGTFGMPARMATTRAMLKPALAGGLAAAHDQVVDR